MKTEPYHPWLHRTAVLTACLSLLPIVVGAVVTTLDAGMAFADWPSSDGHNMLLYPWLKSAGDKFVEHGHRLAGMLIGFVSIILTVVVWRTEGRRWVRIAGTLVLLGVIVQGLLGGLRVLQDARLMALVHGNFAAWVFTLVSCVVLFTGRMWQSVSRMRFDVDFSLLKPLAVLTPVVILTQFLLGGVVRHLGTALHEHLGFAFVALLFVLMTVVAGHRTGVTWLRRAGYFLLLVVGLQIALGAGAWMTKFGYAPWGYVAVQHSTLQVAIRSGHTVCGMLLFMAAVNFALRVFRLDWCQRHNPIGFEECQTVPTSLSAAGGLR